MRPRASLALLFLTAACGAPPNIKLSAPAWPHGKNVPLEVSATVTWPDGLPFRGPVEFRTSSGRISPVRVMADSSGTAKTVLTASAGQVLVTAEATSASESVWISFEESQTGERPVPRPPPTPILSFRSLPDDTQQNSPLRPEPVVAAEILSADPLANPYGMEVLVTLNVTSCAALLDPASKLTESTIGGIGVFNDVRFTTAATGCYLVATSPGFRGIQSTRFDVLP